MNFNDPSEFGRAYQKLVVTDPHKIREQFEAGQLADDEAAFDLEQAKVYLHPDGEHFEVANLCGRGGCVTTTGRVIPANEWVLCRVLRVNKRNGGGA
ncbi:hypothetical protein [Marinobacter sp.]|uniref:hypothetical protein n=1 Tax=Marinobacter sp. TaxID=50741 RepID=UPI0035C67F35